MKKIIIFLFILFLFVGAIVLISSKPSYAQAACATLSTGDADCDGKITLKDAEQLRLELNGASTKKADFNNDTRIDLLDIGIWMRNYAAKFSV